MGKFSRQRILSPIPARVPVPISIAFIASVIAVALAAGSTSASDEVLDRAEALIVERRFEEARTLLLRIVDRPAHRARSLVMLTRACNGLQDWECGVEYGQQAVELLPDSSDAQFQYAVALRIKLTNISRVKAIFAAGSYKSALRRARELDPKNLDAREEEIGFLSQAPAIAGGSKKKARQRIEELKRLDRRRGMMMDADLARVEGDEERARGVYSELVQRDPDDAGSRLNLAYSYQRAERFAEADEQFTALLDDDDQELALSARYQLARSRVLGRYEQERAVELLDAYIAELPADVRGLPSKSAAYWRLGMAHEQLGRADRARAAYGTALELDGGNDEARKSLDRLSGGSP